MYLHLIIIIKLITLVLNISNYSQLSKLKMSTFTIPPHIVGYTGHIPTVNRSEEINYIIHTKHIPGYAGYIPSIYSENKYGESYGKETAKSIEGSIPKGSDVPPYERYTSTARETYKNQRYVQTLSTAELLGISSRKSYYKRPIPIDTINKYWGIDTVNDKGSSFVEKQSYERNYEKFWEFLDTNELDYEYNEKANFDKSNEIYWGVQKEAQELHPELKYDPIPGYQGTNRSIVSENIFGMTFKNSIRRADELLNKIKNDKAQQLYKSSMSYGSFKPY